MRLLMTVICDRPLHTGVRHYIDVIMTTMASQITSLTVVYSIVYSGAHQRKHQSSASLTFVQGIHRGPVNSPHKWPVTRKMFPFDDVIMAQVSTPVTDILYQQPSETNQYQLAPCSSYYQSRYYQPKMAEGAQGKDVYSVCFSHPMLRTFIRVHLIVYTISDLLASCVGQ